MGQTPGQEDKESSSGKVSLKLNNIILGYSIIININHKKYWLHFTHSMYLHVLTVFSPKKVLVIM